MGSSLAEICYVYMPAENRAALSSGTVLPEHAHGAALFADISGFTPLTEALTHALGLRRGAEELPIHLNHVYDGLIREIDRFGGSVIGFTGDAITCWFDDHPAGMRAPQPPGGVRAAACSMALQSAMRAFAAIPVPGQDPVSLSVKVSVASGPIRRFIAGDPAIQRVELIAGATVFRMAAGEHQASKGEVIFDEATAAACGSLTAISGWREAGSERFAVISGLAEAHAEAPWPALPPAALNDQLGKVWMLPPIYERLAAGMGDYLTELRPVTALLIKFGGIDFDNDPQAGQKLDAYIRWAQNVLNKYEAVLMNATIGDKGSYLCTSFGAPVAHDDDTRRAASAALEMLHTPAELSFITPAQIGIAQGMVRTGPYGGSTRRTYDILGDQVNLAARLMTRAQPGEILVSEHVQKQVERDFALESLEPIMVKGKSLPVAIARLVGRRAQAAGVQALLQQQGALYGRDQELATLDGALDTALSGEAQLIRLEGTAGVGKSRLTAEFVGHAIAHGLRAEAGACQSTQQDVTFLAWQPVLRGLLGLDPEEKAPASFLQAVLSEIKPDWAVRTPLLGVLLGLELPDNPTTAAMEPRLRFEATLTLAVDLLRSAAAAQPLLVVLDDIHWLDEASRELVLAAARGVGDLPFILLLVQRPAADLLAELEKMPGYQRLNLSVLSQTAIAQIVAARLDAPASPLVAGVVQAQAQGVPYFAEQMLAVMQETGSLVKEDGHWDFPEKIINALRDADSIQKNLDTSEWELIPGAHIPTAAIGLPDSVQGAMLARIDRLPEPEKLTLRTASVLGSVFELPILERAHPAFPGEQVLQKQLERFLGRGFIMAEEDEAGIYASGKNTSGKYAFTHNALQEVLYSSLPTAVQEDVHTRAGAALEALAPSDLPALAYHYSKGGAPARPKALYYLDRAAAHAQKYYANATALNYYRQALSLEERWQWRKGQAEVLHLLGVRDEEKEAIEALEMLPDAPQSEAHRLWYELYFETADYEQAMRAAEKLARESQDWLDDAISLRREGLVLRKQGKNEEALERYFQAQALFDSHPEDRRDQVHKAQVQLLTSMGWAYIYTGQFEQADDRLKQGLLIAKVIDNQALVVETFTALGSSFMYQQKMSQANEYFNSALNVSKKLGDRSGEARAATNLALVFRDSGQFSRAIEFMTSSLRLLQATGDRWSEISNWNGLGAFYQELGLYAQSEHALQQADHLSRAIGDESAQVYVQINLGIVKRDQGDIEQAVAFLNSGLDLARKAGEALMETAYQSQLALLAAARQQYEQAIAYAEQAMKSRLQMGCENIISDNLAALAMGHLGLGNPELALKYARLAHEVVAGCGGQGPENPAQDDFMAYQVLEALGESAEARAALQEAYVLIQSRGQAIQEPELRASFFNDVPINQQIIAAAGRVL